MSAGNFDRLVEGFVAAICLVAIWAVCEATGTPAWVTWPILASACLKWAWLIITHPSSGAPARDD